MKSMTKFNPGDKVVLENTNTKWTIDVSLDPFYKVKSKTDGSWFTTYSHKDEIKFDDEYILDKKLEEL